jgi:hypothetical protein
VRVRVIGPAHCKAVELADPITLTLGAARHRPLPRAARER